MPIGSIQNVSNIIGAPAQPAAPQVVRNEQENHAHPISTGIVEAIAERRGVLRSREEEGEQGHSGARKEARSVGPTQALNRDGPLPEHAAEGNRGVKRKTWIDDDLEELDDDDAADEYFEDDDYDYDDDDIEWTKERLEAKYNRAVDRLIFDWLNMLELAMDRRRREWTDMEIALWEWIHTQMVCQDTRPDWNLPSSLRNMMSALSGFTKFALMDIPGGDDLINIYMNRDPLNKDVLQ
ncbi:hypothetical protein KC19_7G170500 [Ceratodon purpureus]|uniref:Uncharacterized protein n=1 Tax=Ceratodon purpureus TaxID=3225 RepID=A0A8T0H9H5_CERPU|nr:hypothetical protein KC19_7G170500 [Ceratodon purpureus]